MLNLPEFPTTTRIDARSEELLGEFQRHNDDVTASIRRKHPELIKPEGLHEALMFTGWATQKIASLQLLVEWQQEAIKQLINERTSP